MPEDPSSSPSLIKAMATISISLLLTHGALREEGTRLVLAAAYWPPYRHLAEVAVGRLPKGGPRQLISTDARDLLRDYCDRLGHTHPADAVELCAMVLDCLGRLVDAGYEFIPEVKA